MAGMQRGHRGEARLDGNTLQETLPSDFPNRPFALDARWAPPENAVGTMSPGTSAAELSNTVNGGRLPDACRAHEKT